MTGLLSRAAAWLIEPSDDHAEAATDRAPSATAPPSSHAADATPRRFLPPTARRVTDPEAVHRATAESAGSPPLAALRAASPAPLEPPPAPVERPPSLVEPPPAEAASPSAPPRGRTGTRPARRHDTPATEPVRAVALGPAADALVLAAALALTVRCAQRAAAALVFVYRAGDGPWRTPPPVMAAPGLPAARSVAARLLRRGIPAEPHGRLVWIPLDGASAEAPATIRGAESARGDVPSVVAVLGPRDAAADALLAGRAPVVIAGAHDSPLAELAGSDLGVPVHAWSPPRGVARLAILAGLHAPANDELLATPGGQAPTTEAADR